MPYFIARYFCPTRGCPEHHKLQFQKGNCPACHAALELIRYCPNCYTAGVPAQNRICYKCKRHLVDLLETPKLREEPPAEGVEAAD
jgi:predicted amidophosphoribosyltransferase